MENLQWIFNDDGTMFAIVNPIYANGHLNGGQSISKEKGEFVVMNPEYLINGLPNRNVFDNEGEAVTFCNVNKDIIGTPDNERAYSRY